MICITGDTHRKFQRIYDFCQIHPQLQPTDIMILLGDTGLNYFGGARDEKYKRMLSTLPLTLLCIHGNHEQRPEEIPTYQTIPWRGGLVYQEPAYPNLLFAQDGSIYHLEGHPAIAIGGAYTANKKEWLAKGRNWWPNEQPSAMTKKRVEQRLEQQNWQVDWVFSHTCPLHQEPQEVFSPDIDQSTVDKSTEQWLQTIADRLSYQAWFCGHFHTEKTVQKLQILFESIKILTK